MGFTVIVEEEGGAEIASHDDRMGTFHVLLAPIQGDQTFKMLIYIDWEGTTAFNALQTPVLRQELKRLAIGDRTAAELEVLERLIELTVVAEADVHRHLKFYGD